jgi:integral membrane protein
MTESVATNKKADAWPRKAAGAALRYRIMAWATGTMLLLLCLELVLKYVLHANGVGADGHPNPVIGSWVAYAHGWLYVVYLLTVFDLWSKMRWRIGRLATMAAAGVVPVMSFILERKVHAQAVARIEAATSSQA